MAEQKNPWRKKLLKALTIGVITVFASVPLLEIIQPPQNAYAINVGLKYIAKSITKSLSSSSSSKSSSSSSKSSSRTSSNKSSSSTSSKNTSTWSSGNTSSNKYTVDKNGNIYKNGKYVNTNDPKVRQALNNDPGGKAALNASKSVKTTGSFTSSSSSSSGSSSNKTSTSKNSSNKAQADQLTKEIQKNGIYGLTDYDAVAALQDTNKRIYDSAKVVTGDLILGYEDGTAKFDKTISKGEMALILARNYGYNLDGDDGGAQAMKLLGMSGSANDSVNSKELTNVIQNQVSKNGKGKYDLQIVEDALNNKLNDNNLTRGEAIILAQNNGSSGSSGGKSGSSSGSYNTAPSSSSGKSGSSSGSNNSSPSSSGGSGNSGSKITPPSAGTVLTD